MNFDRFVGIPFLDRGRSLEACDCWGLCGLVYREALDVELPSYDDRLVTGADRLATARLIAGEINSWQEVKATEERPLDVVLMREGKFVRHVGVVTSPGMLLHVQPNQTSRIERYRSGILANRVVGFYRYRDRE